MFKRFIAFLILAVCPHLSFGQIVYTGDEVGEGRHLMVSIQSDFYYEDNDGNLKKDRTDLEEATILFYWKNDVGVLTVTPKVYPPATMLFIGYNLKYNVYPDAVSPDEVTGEVVFSGNEIALNRQAIVKYKVTKSKDRYIELIFDEGIKKYYIFGGDYE